LSALWGGLCGDGTANANTGYHKPGSQAKRETKSIIDLISASGSFARCVPFRTPNKQNNKHNAKPRAAQRKIKPTGPKRARQPRASARMPRGTAYGLSEARKSRSHAMSQPKATETVITHREYLRDVGASAAFYQEHLPLNPGSSSTFPWLASIARNFEQYHFDRLVFHYKSTSATAVASTNTALGTVILATQYDMQDNVFNNKQSMEAYEGAVATNPSISVSHRVDTAARHSTLTRLFVRDDAVAGDARFYDVGSFTVGVAGMQAAAIIGELWAEYTVRLYKPKFPQLGSSPHIHVAELPVAGANATYPFGNLGGQIKSNVGCFWDTSTLRASFSRAGDYVAVLTQVGSALFSTPTNLVVIGAGIAVKPAFRWGATSAVAVSNSSTISSATLCFTVTDISTAFVGLNQQAGYTSGNTDLVITHMGTAFTEPEDDVEARVAALLEEVRSRRPQLRSAAAAAASAAATEEKDGYLVARPGAIPGPDQTGWFRR
jgi:hypothetical protein